MQLINLKNKINNFFSGVLTDPGRKSIVRMLLEYFTYLLTNHTIASQYFTKFIYRKDCADPRKFLLTQQIQSGSMKLGNPIYFPILDNKYFFEQFFALHNINVVKSFAHNYNTLFFVSDHLIQINSFEEFKSLIRTLFTTSKNGFIFIKKKEGSWGGKQVYRISMSQLNNDTTELLSIYNEVLQSGFIFQDAIIQHDDINKLNPSCINTVRIVTYRNREGITRTIPSFIRLGRGTSSVDNISSGGMYVGINDATGTLLSESFSDFSHGKGKSFKTHPETGVVFENYKIPYFMQAQQLCIDAANFIPQIKVIGWDIAITPGGPILIEGNHNPGIDSNEVVHRGFKNNATFMDMLNEVNSLHKLNR